MRFRPGFSVRFAAVAVVAAWGTFLPASARAYEFVDLATYTTSTTQTVGHACVLYNGTDMSCASTTPYVTSAGLVGIGTSNPTTALEVSGTVSATAFVGNGAGLTGITASVNDGLSGSIVYRDEFGGLHANSTFNISSTTGSVGIGAGAPSWLGNNGLYVAGSIYSPGKIFVGGSGSLYVTNGPFLTVSNSVPLIRTYSSIDLSFAAGGSGSPEAMRIANATQYVGIGTTGPQTPLDVSGAIKISGDGTEGCTTTADEGKIRRNPVTKRFQICAH